MKSDLPIDAPAEPEPPSPAESQSETNAGVARATGVVALGNIGSRVLGLAREIVITNLFGATGAATAFRVAVLVPKALYDLLIGGHVNSAIVPVLSEVVTVQGRAELWRLVSALLSLVTVGLSLLVLLIELAADPIVHLLGVGYSEPTLELATHLLRLTAPALIFLGLFAVLSGTLYALRMFTWPAFAGVVFNGSIVLVTLVLAPTGGITMVALGWLVGALAQMAMQLIGLRRARFALRIDWRHPALRRIAALYAPVMFSLILDTLVIRTFSYNLASQTGDSSINYMELATTLIQFPQGLIATAISIAILPTLARQAAQVGQAGHNAFRDTLGLGLRLAVTLILPAAVGLFVLADPIVRLLFEHGAFTAEDVPMTVLALRLYLFGLPFAAVDLLLVYAFYARQDTLTPALVGLLSLTIYMGAAILLFPHLGLFSLMVADSLKHLIHALVSGVLLGWRLRGFGGQRLALTTGRAALAALGMGLAAALVTPPLMCILGGNTLFEELALVLLSGSISGLAYLALALVLRIEELRWLFGLLRGRLRRG